MFSQYNEEEIVLHYFSNRVASFLDIGAWDGITLSNTRALSILGWSGVLVEPCPSAFVELLSNTSPFPKLLCVNAAISGQRQVRKFHLQREWGGTLNDSRALSDIRMRTGDYYTLTMSPDDLYEVGTNENMRFEFVSLDAEWMDEQILANSANLLSKTELLCVEVTDSLFAGTDPIPRVCSMLGFNRMVGKTPCNLIVSR